MTWVLWALVVVALALLLAEALMRRAARYEDEPLWWHDRFTMHKELQMRRLQRAGGVDVVVIGTSMMLYGVDPVVLTRRTGLRVYNASIYRGVPTVSEAWLRDRVLPMLRPQVVVVGMSPVEVNDNSPLNTRLGEYRDAPVWRGGVLRSLHRQAALRSWLALYLPMARQPRRFLSVLLRGLRSPHRWTVPLEVPGVLGREGQGEDFADRSFKVMPRMRELVMQQVGRDYDNGGEQESAYRRIAELVQESGARVVFAAMPLPAELHDEVFQGGRANWAAQYDRLAALADEVGAPLVDVAEGFEDSRYYGDLVHLNGEGRQVFSERLADALHPLLFDEAASLRSR